MAELESVSDAQGLTDGDPEAQPLALPLPLIDAVLQPLPVAVRGGEALPVTDGELDSDAVGRCDAEGECDEVLLALAQGDFVARALLLRLAGAESEGVGASEAVLRLEVEPLLLGEGDGDKVAVGRGEALLRPEFVPRPLGEGE